MRFTYSKIFFCRAQIFATFVIECPLAKLNPCKNLFQTKHKVPTIYITAKTFGLATFWLSELHQCDQEILASFDRPLRNFLTLASLLFQKTYIPGIFNHNTMLGPAVEDQRNFTKNAGL